MYTDTKPGTPMAVAKNGRKNIIDSVIRHAKKELAAEQLALVSTFIQQYFSNVPLDELADRGVDDLYSMVLSHWNLIYQRKPLEAKVRAYNPTSKKEGWTSSHTIIEIAVDDMPFLVDSMRMELNRLSYSTHLVIHLGGMQVRRNEQHQITEVLPFEAAHKEGLVEASIYMEIDRQNDESKLAEIEANLYRILNDVRLTVSDWFCMKDRVQEAIHYLQTAKLPQSKESIDEAVEFLRWLLDEHFTFLGYRDYQTVAKGDEKSLKIVSDSGLGVLRDERHTKALRHLSTLPDVARRQALSDELLIISKTNTKSTVHRPTYTDYIGVKKFNEAGEIVGEYRFIGLFTSDAYNSEPQDIPYFRRKVNTILEHSGVLHHGHAAKALLNIVETLPRDDLFQGSVEDLTDMSLGIWHLQERRRIRLFLRQDAYSRYMSCLVYMPRENINTDLILQMQQVLVDAFEGHEVSYTTYFPESVLARIHYVIRTNPKHKQRYDVKSLESDLVEVGRTWKDALRDELLATHGEEKGNEIIARYLRAFPAGYREVFTPTSAVYDIARIEELRSGHDMSMSFYRPPNAEGGMLKFKLYRFDQTIPLSDALPMLEKMGLRVLGEQPYEIFLEGRSVWVNDFHMYYPYDDDLDVKAIKERFQDAFYRIWKGFVGNDTFNRLVLSAGLSWRQVSILRTYSKYFKQAGVTFSLDYLSDAVNNNPALARLLVRLFETRFGCEEIKDRAHQVELLQKKIERGLDDVASLDEDRIIRHFVATMMATLRTNFYQLDEHGQSKPYIAIKLNPKEIPGLPLPLPAYETFVYSPRVEGVHLRSSNVARGGLRWSDRKEDFRTEVLGLMKAQQVKNAVIVPSGAKGGFICKKLPLDGNREDIMVEGIECYKMFIRGLLDVVDNIKGKKHVTPKNTIKYDDNDPYLVVAADKGTATFSDIANSISAEYQFWLGDAFASGGSAGYDHKKMGITARGAWESVKCHFRELGKDPHKENFTTIGIGDMAGDVFGNGLLMSEHCKLVAAFNHVHIFLDPNPDAMQSYQERIRLYNMPRSSWEDYDPKLISKGGGVFKRSAKAIALSPEVQAMLGIHKETMVPNELIKAILRMKADLLWNGGIGTYVKASHETHLDVGDRANDALRVDAKSLNVRIVGEGGNLGFTQLGRIEYALHGGLMITDFIDNSGGVDCSDTEVNIKILFTSALASKQLSLKQRNRLLSAMTDDVANLVLKNNYRQARAISYAVSQSKETLELYRQFMDWYEKHDKLPRALEYLPTNEVLNERKANMTGLTRPELAVMMAYSKIILKGELLSGDLPDDPALFDYVISAFPARLAKQYKQQMQDHKLRREIVATQLSNEIITNMGITYVYQLQDETSQSAADVVKAYVVASRIFDFNSYLQAIESLDYQISTQTQFELTTDINRLIRRSTRWFLRNRRHSLCIEDEVNFATENLPELIKALPRLVSSSQKTGVDEHVTHYVDHGVPLNVAKRFAMTRSAYSTLNILEATKAKRMDPIDVAKIYFGLMEQLDLIWFREQINSYPINNHWAILARAAFKGDLDSILRVITIGVLSMKVTQKKADARLKAWITAHQDHVDRWRDMVADLRSANTSEFSMLSVAMRELVDLAQTCGRDEVRDEIHLL